ncbi:hypothetical protein KUCAC02_035693 [Chaenocephalus aceratus]|nr:hypothetical protein KUCAC02_035693 [Chaenocephalus aceratus]
MTSSVKVRSTVLPLLYYFKCHLHRSNKNIRSFPKSAKKRTGPKTVRVPFFFLASSSEKTPKPSEELILLQAGLGRRSAHVPEDADHKEITNILCEVYPKMAELEGAWLIHKAMSKKQKIQFTHTDESDDDVQFLNTTEDYDNQMSTDKATSSGHKVACPVCGELFSQS